MPFVHVPPPATCHHTTTTTKDSKLAANTGNFRLQIAAGSTAGARHQLVQQLPVARTPSSGLVLMRWPGLGRSSCRHMQPSWWTGQLLLLLQGKGRKSAVTDAEQAKLFLVRMHAKRMVL
jgi:hypothetical protein